MTAATAIATGSGTHHDRAVRPVRHQPPAAAASVERDDPRGVGLVAVEEPLSTAA